MILGIRTDSPVLVLIGLDAEGLRQETHELHRAMASEILAKVTGFVGHEGGGTAKIKGVIVYEGPGSFTGLRIGITVANTIAYANKCPVVGATGDDWFNKGKRKLEQGVDPGIVFPAYGSEAHVTL